MISLIFTTIIYLIALAALFQRPRQPGPGAFWGGNERGHDARRLAGSSRRRGNLVVPTPGKGSAPTAEERF